MKMTVERELRVEDVLSGKIISVKTGEVTEENSEIDTWLARTYACMYGYVLTKGEGGHFDFIRFGFEDIGGAINACKAAALDRKGKPVARRAFLFQSAHYKHVEPHFARRVAVEVAFAL